MDLEDYIHNCEPIAELQTLMGTLELRKFHEDLFIISMRYMRPFHTIRYFSKIFLTSKSGKTLPVSEGEDDGEHIILIETDLDLTGFFVCDPDD